MSEIRVDNIISADGSTAPSYTLGVKVAAGQTITNLGDFTTSGNTTLSGPVTFGSGARITRVTTFADSLNNVNITGISTFADGARITGVVTFVDGVSGLNVVGPATFTQGATVTGICTFQNINVTAGVTTFTGNVSVGGTLTYEDVTNIDSLGIITARSDVKVGRNFNVTGISTFHTNSTVHVGAGITIYGNNSLFHSVGIVSASSFHGSGSNLTGIDATSLKDNSGNIKAQATSTGIGIGTNAPTEELHLHKEAATGPHFQISNTSTGVASGDGLHVGYDGNNNAEIINKENSAIVFGTNSLERVRVLGSGVLGIGTATNGVSKVFIHGGSVSVSGSDANFGAGGNRAFFDHDASNVRLGFTGGGSTAAAHGIVFYTTNAETGTTARLELQAGGNLHPAADNTQNLGSSSRRWANVYTGDLHLSNEGRGNDIDGTSGAWTMQEGSDDLFLINNKTGKKYKFNLTEVS